MKKNMQICWLSNMQTFTVRIYSTFLFALLSQLALAQFHDDFSDENFTASPTWTGTDQLFIVTESRLVLNGGKKDSVAYLSLPCSVSNPGVWEFDFSFRFNPSGANYSKVYLISDEPDLIAPLHGYFVMLGRNKDAISLYKQTGLTLTEIVKGRDDILDLSSIEARVKVTRDESGWKLFTDIGSNGVYTLEGSSEDNDIVESSHFGIVCTYTSTRSENFAFDDFNVSEVIAIDIAPPLLSAIEVVSSTKVQITFSEPLDEESAIRIDNYLIDGSSYPMEVVLAEDQRSVVLIFANEISQQTHSITISGVADINANHIDVFLSEFKYVLPAVTIGDDVIITEIFADPSPSVGLAEAEFIEIYNRSDKTFDLGGWSFTDGSSKATLPTFILAPKTYLVLAAESSSLHFQNALFLKGFPSLNNSNDALVLKDKNSTAIDSVNYDQSWYRDINKEDGGWSLELIDPDNLCAEGENWAASEDEKGGTPGFENSIIANKPDLHGPRLIAAFAVDSLTLRLRFDEKLEKPITSELQIETDPNLEKAHLRFSNPALTEIEVSVLSEIQKGISYSLTVTNIKDCAGNTISEEDAKTIFGMPEDADSSDVLINEVLFNPRPTGADFVEILNNSAKFINLHGWSISNSDNDKFAIITDSDLILAPGEYLAITPNVPALEGEYIQDQKVNFVQVKNLPSFDDDSGSVTITDSNGNAIDFFRYSKEMHSVFIKDDEGVSLERISSTATNESQNWASASRSVGFATPGLKNSNTLAFDQVEKPLLVEPEIFNPLSGQPNFALIHYNFEQSGYVANIKIFDSYGRKVREVANNDLLGTHGFYRWDGDRDAGSKASLGSYMIWFEVFNQEGTVKRYQRRVAIASSFE